MPSGVTGNWAANVVTISGSPTTTAGSPFNYTVTLTGGCGPVATATGTITVTPNNTITLTSAAGTNAQTVCINTPITDITYSTTGATGATFSGLPAGVTGTWAANVVTISGSPTTTVGSPFSYTVTLTGGCGVVTATGTITVTPANTITLTSAAGTNAQTVCQNTAITNITYSTSGATGATFSGLPAGVTGNWAVNVVTISGSPTTAVGSPFNYTVTLTGGCGVITATGTITVNPTPTVNAVSNQVICNNTATAAVTFDGTPPGVVFNWTNNNASIGLAASGTGDIPSFTAINTTNAPVVATVTVTPSTGGGGGPVTQTFNYTGSMQSWTVPAGVTVIQVDARGGAGGFNGGIAGGMGGRTLASISVTPGQVIEIYVGQAGVNTAGSNPPVYNGGGGVFSYSSGGTAGTGGGGTDLRISPYGLANRLVIAGGGGGGGYQHVGGHGGGLTGQDGVPFPSFPNSGGKGGSQMSGGAQGVACCSCPAYTTSGSLGNGGNGAGDGAGGGGGGGGYFGGGGSCFAGGGGGSSYAHPAATLVSHTQGFQTGDGQLIITYQIANGCTGSSRTFTFTVNPTPNAVATPSSQTRCSGVAIQTIALTGNVSGTVYNWTRNNGDVASGTVTGIAASGSGDISGTLTNTTTSPVTVTFTVTPSYTNAGVTCTGTPITATVLVNPTNTITLSSAAGTDNQTVLINTPITDITYATTFATGATFSGLPAGVNGSWAANVVTISGSPSVGPGTFNYTVTLTGGCGAVTATGTITVFNCSITLTSAAGTDAQTVCNNTSITDITYSTTGATGAAFSGLPSGVNGNWAANVVTISGTPTVAGTFNYTVTLTGGGCGAFTASGTITVNPIPDVDQPANQVVCNNTTTAPVNFTGSVAGTVFNWTNNNTSIGLAASGTGDIPSFTAINTTNAPVVATVTVTPVYTVAAAALLTRHLITQAQCNPGQYPQE